MPTFQPILVKSFQTNGDPGNSPAGGQEAHHYTINLENATIASARHYSASQGFGAAQGFTAGGVKSAPGNKLLAHELTHAAQQSSGSDKTIVLEGVTPKGVGAMPFDMLLRGRNGQQLEVFNATGRSVMKGRLSKVERVGFAGSDWKVTLSGAVSLHAT